ncbi:MAG: FtsH protease activity modulator HflK [Nanoarchaeota archaeon]|nr:FtsH protease activity modulator HflK [Nanoarchaeota archaeon]MCG2718451.1 FtsH protease activity modulator HflK [Nanoarchaeota archaeon]
MVSKTKLALTGLAAFVASAVAGVGYLQYIAQPDTYAEYKIDEHQKDVVPIENKIIYETEAGHQKVLLGLGGLWERVTGPGYNFRIPLVEVAHDVDVARVFKVERGFRTAKAGIETTYEDDSKFEDEALMVTGDEGELKVKYVIQYMKKDASDFLFNLENPHETVAQVGESAIREVIATRGYDAVLTTEKDVIKEEAKDIAQKVLDGYGAGVKLIGIRLQQIVPPTLNVQKSFDGLNDAEQKKVQLEQEGMKEYEKEIQEALGTKQRMIQDARGTASEKVNRAEGRVSRFNNAYEEFKLAPDANRYRLHQEAMRELLKKSNVKIVDDNLLDGNTLNHIFLDKEVPK